MMPDSYYCYFCYCHCYRYRCCCGCCYSCCRYDYYFYCYLLLRRLQSQEAKMLSLPAQEEHFRLPGCCSWCYPHAAAGHKGSACLSLRGFVGVNICVPVGKHTYRDSCRNPPPQLSMFRFMWQVRSSKGMLVPVSASAMLRELGVPSRLPSLLNTSLLDCKHSLRRGGGR